MKPILSLKTMIRCRDFEASKAFYVGLLGLPIVEEWDHPGDQGCIVEFGPGGGFLEMLGPEAATPSRRAEFESAVLNDKIELQVHVASLDDWVSRLHGAVETEGPVSRPWGNRYLWMRDPDGIRVALWDRSDQPEPAS